MPEAVLFEFEGVLAQTGQLRLSALLRALAARGFEPPAAAIEPRLGSRSPRAALDLLAERGAVRLDETDRELIALNAEEEFSRLAAAGLTLVRGARECILRLQASMRLGIVTRAGRREVESALSLSGLEAAFECIIAREDVSLPKPSPRGHELALERLTRRRPIVAGLVMALEDGAAGIRAALAAGTVAVAAGDVPPDEAVEAHAYVASLEDLTAASLDALLRAAERAS